jgi:hypothetical protein
MTPALQGTIDRLAGDPTLAALVGSFADGSGPRITTGWPWDVVDPEGLPEAARRELPRVTVLKATDTIRRPGIGASQIQVDVWVWPVGEGGGAGRLSEIDARIVELLDEAHWVWEGLRLYAISETALDFPAAPGEPLRRMRPFEVRYSRI